MSMCKTQHVFRDILVFQKTCNLAYSQAHQAHSGAFQQAYSQQAYQAYSQAYQAYSQAYQAYSKAYQAYSQAYQAYQAYSKAY